MLTGVKIKRDDPTDNSTGYAQTAVPDSDGI